MVVGQGLTTIQNIFKSFLLLFYCIVSIFPPLPFSAQPTTCFHSQFPHCCPCLWVIHTCSLTSPFPFFPLNTCCVPKSLLNALPALSCSFFISWGRVYDHPCFANNEIEALCVKQLVLGHSTNDGDVCLPSWSYMAPFSRLHFLLSFSLKFF